MLAQFKEYQDASGYHHCYIDTFASGRDNYVIPARILGMSLSEYVQFIIDNYNPDKIIYNEKNGYVGFAWSSQTTERKLKTFLNKKAKEKNFQI